MGSPVFCFYFYQTRREASEFKIKSRGLSLGFDSSNENTSDPQNSRDNHQGW